MKKISLFILALCLSLSLNACSKKSDEDVHVFFQAFHHTLELDSARIAGSMELKTSTQSQLNFDLEFIQGSNLALALNIGMESGPNRVDDYICFYIQDGKTYLKNLDVTSSSTLANLGLDPDATLAKLDPFLKYTNEELSGFFTSTSRNGSVYTMTIDPKELAKLLDDYGSIEIEKADITATIEDDVMTRITFYVKGRQVIGAQKVGFEITLQAKVSDINAIKEIEFPDGMSEWPSE